MKLTRKLMHLFFVAEEKDTQKDQEFLKLVDKYSLIAHGASVRVFEKNDKVDRLIAQINPFDNTILVHETEGIELAAKFGGKRFIVGNARKELTATQAAEINATHFSRDRSFPVALDTLKDEVKINYRAVSFAKLKQLYKADQQKLYTALASLFDRCADFTPGKQDEYVSKEANKPKYNGKLLDKYARFNSYNVHLFLIDEENAIVGAISVTPQGAYFYDEVVDYFKLLNKEDTETVLMNCDELHKINTQESAKLKDLEESEGFAKDLKAILIDVTKKEFANKRKHYTDIIASIVEPKRTKLLEQLFAAARKRVEGIKSDEAFIRVAAGREMKYEELGCGKENKDFYVIHGQPTPQLKLLDTFMKDWAYDQLVALEPKPSKLSLLSRTAQPFIPEEKAIRNEAPSIRQ